MNSSCCVAADILYCFCYLLKSVGVDRLRFLFCSAAATAFTSEFWFALLPISTVEPSLFVILSRPTTLVLLLPLGIDKWSADVTMAFNEDAATIWLLLNFIFCWSCCWICACFCKCNCAVNTIEFLLLTMPDIFVPVGFDATIICAVDFGVCAQKKRKEISISIVWLNGFAFIYLWFIDQAERHTVSGIESFDFFSETFLRCPCAIQFVSVSVSVGGCGSGSGRGRGNGCET